jgi:hypothetical protein
VGLDERGNPFAQHRADECRPDGAMDLVVTGGQGMTHVVEESGQLELCVLGMGVAEVCCALEPVMQDGEAADVFIGLFEGAGAS